jgi:VCBS repeat-containing protein
MKLRTLTLLVAALLVGAVAGYAAAGATYQKTGVVKEAGKDTFTLDLGKEGEWRFYTDGSTKGADAVKAGQKVTVTYKQMATSIEAKGDAKADAKGKKK